MGGLLPDLRTRDGSQFEFPASTLTKGPTKRIVVYDEQGREHLYIAIRFVQETANGSLGV